METIGRWFCAVALLIFHNEIQDNLMKRHDVTGQRFGSWLAVEFTECINNRSYWLCRCDCGEEGRVALMDLKSGGSKSCGKCSHRGGGRYIHGLRYTKEYRIWRYMKQRCLNPRNKAYSYYGQRGITVCDRWLHSVENFIADMGESPSPAHSLERIDNNLGYSPDNCKWATQKEQRRNTRNNRLLSYNGETLCVSAWAERLSVPFGRLHGRLRAGWPVEQILNAPKHDRGQRR